MAAIQSLLAMVAILGVCLRACVVRACKEGRVRERKRVRERERVRMRMSGKGRGSGESLGSREGGRE